MRCSRKFIFQCDPHERDTIALALCAQTRRRGRIAERVETIGKDHLLRDGALHGDVRQIARRIAHALRWPPLAAGEKQADAEGCG